MPPDSRPDWVFPRRQEIGHCIARHRAARGWTVEQLAEAAELPRLAVVRAENARNSTGLDVLLQLAHGLDMPIGRMLEPPEPDGG